MPVIKTVQSLVSSLGGVVLADDPLKALEEQGLVLSPALQKKLQGIGGQKVLSPAERRRLARRLKELELPGFSEKIRFKVGKPPQVVFKKLSEGDYDLLVGLRLTVIDQTLEGLYQSRTWPSRFAPDDADDLFPLSRLHTFSSDIPDEEGLRVGVLHLVTAPTVTAVSSGQLVLHQAFELDLDVVRSGVPRFTLTTLSGMIDLQVPVVARTDPQDQEKLIIVFGDETDEDLADSRLTIAPASPVQPRDSDALEALGAFVLRKISDALVLKTAVQKVFSLCPKINLPVGQGINIFVQRADARAVPAEDGDLVMVGVLAGRDAVPTVGAGDPVNLVFDPFVTQASNFFISAHEEFINKVADGSLGFLEMKLAAKTEDLPVVTRVDGVRIKLKGPNKIQFIVDARLVNFCGLAPGLNPIDLNFTATWTARVSVFNGVVQYETSTVDINYDNTDLVLCAVSGVVDVLIGVFTGNALFIMAAILGGAFLLGAGVGELAAEAKSDEGTGSREGIFDLLEPIPGTELLPRAEAVQASVVEDRLHTLGLVTLRPDDLHTFLYASIRTQLLFAGPSVPVAQATVQVIDQDLPAPPDDDAVPPATQTRTTVNGDILTTVFTTFRRPVRNELLAEGTTDDEGRLRLVIDRRTTAGTIITRTISENTAVDSGVRIKTTERPLSEARPDVFFRVKLPGEEKARDTRPSREGLFFQPNLTSRRLGEPDAPLTLVFRPALGDEVDGNVSNTTL